MHIPFRATLVCICIQFVQLHCYFESHPHGAIEAPECLHRVCCVWCVYHVLECMYACHVYMCVIVVMHNILSKLQRSEDLRMEIFY